MARPLRIEYPGALYHLTARGNRKEDIYLQDDDRTYFLEILGRTVRRYNWICHGYCLMDNHFHLLIETPDANLSLGMRQLNGVYTQYFNRSHDKAGHLFQGRFKSILVEKDSHLLELSRYIVLNPVRGKMVNHPGEWEWSNYRPFALGRGYPDFLTGDWVLGQFSSQKKKARQLFIGFVEDGIDEPAPWRRVKGQIAFGSDTFAMEMKEHLEAGEKPVDLPKYQKHLGRPALWKIIPKPIRADKPKRNRAIITAHIEHGYTLKQIADLLGVHYTTVSKVIAAAEDKNR